MTDASRLSPADAEIVRTAKHLNWPEGNCPDSIKENDVIGYNQVAVVWNALEPKLKKIGAEWREPKAFGRSQLSAEISFGGTTYGPGIAAKPELALLRAVWPLLHHPDLPALLGRL